MLVILTSSITNRLRYITRLIIKEMLGVEVRITISIEEFTDYNGPKISYDQHQLANGLFIEAACLLFETEIFHSEVKSRSIDGIPVIFGSGNPLSALPFDPLAASFYMVSRYEEYHPHTKDSFGRFPATESVACKNGFLDIPIVHLWADMLKKVLGKHFPELKFVHREYQYIPTIDIDHAWCYKGRTITRTLGGIGRSLLNGQIGEITERLKVLAGMKADPYDNFSLVSSLHEKYANFPLFFVLFADYGRNDNNVTVTSKAFHQLIRELDKLGKVGIHPSLSSNSHLSKLENEFEGLCEVLDKDVTISRQHFLKLNMPGTYRTLLQFGITDDYSMGYASHPGFRAGIAIPFPFFDIVNDEVTTLMIHSVTLMDVTMKDYLRLSQDESLEMISKMIQSIKSVNGEFVSLWHNESLGDTGRWKGWREIYRQMVRLAST